MAKDQPISAKSIAIIASIGMFLSTLDSGIINVAIPSFMHIFHAKLNTVIWTVTLYTLIISSTVMLFGKLADRFGRLRIYKLGLSLFALSSFLCGSSPTIHSLILFRTLQGLSAAMMQATAIAVITSTLAKEEITKAIGILGMLMGLGPTLGPVVGGFILSTIGWRWIFWLNIPICLYALYSCRRLRTKKEILQNQPLHYFNFALFGLAMLFLLLSMDYLASNKMLAFLLFIATIIAFSAHIFAELKSSQPIINYHLFKNIDFTAPIIGVMALGSATAIVFILPPLFFEKLHQFSAWQIGLISLSAPLGIVVMSRLFGKFNKGLGTVASMIIGIFLMTLPLIILIKINVAWPTAFIAILLLIYGLGGGLFMTSNIIHLTAQFTLDQQAFISSLIRMIQNAAIAFGAAGSAVLLNNKIGNQNLLLGIQHSWTLAAIITVSALACLSYMGIKNKRSVL